MNIYLAGAIRDDRQEDIDWREEVMENVGVRGVRWLNPLGGKSFDPATKKWDMGGIAPVGSVIVPHDFWMVERSDVILFNFTALQEGYPMIGSLVEFGHATGLSPRPLIYSLISEGYIGTGNPGLLKGLHPFLAENSAVVFTDLNKMINFLNNHLPVLTGQAPSFQGAHVVRG